MKLSGIVLGGCLAFALTAFAAPRETQKVKECVAGPPTAASYTWNFQKEADGILKDVQPHVETLSSEADTLQSYKNNGEIDWQAQEVMLSRMADDIDYVGHKLCRLETIRRIVTPEQQQAIDKIASGLVLMANSADDALYFGNSQPLHLWAPEYRKYMDNIYSDAQALTSSVQAAVEYAKATHPREELGRAGASGTQGGE